VLPVNPACEPRLQRDIGVTFLNFNASCFTIFTLETTQFGNALSITINKEIGCEGVSDFQSDAR
jgi:hypothetical protein